ncbi:beta strand repeat-containing protein [Frigoriglobus tundricola]|uniref:IPT/TIG domain-containing protein n=1 Tax=Frigoriglobus tundricola TaxID=2774151 RepID=A0A6M5YYN1_9BACT|nr:IPT/TIG domain-containing protein [Frigoriglobus tundricola]QJW99065.1 hypothetical protein FTUN_6663 [Frigoriglobus tundricola]
MSRLSRILDELTGRKIGYTRTGRAPRAWRAVEELEPRDVPSLAGQQLFPADYPLNQNIANAPVAANSAAIINQIGAAISIHPDLGADSASNGNALLYGIPINVVHGNSVSKVNVAINGYPSESDPLPVPIPASAVIEGDYQGGPNLGGVPARGDSHLIVFDADNDIAYELYGASRPTDTTNHTGGWEALQESVWNMSTNTFRTLGDTSADAAGLSILATLLRPDEANPVSQGGQGAINHALRFTLPSGDINPQYVYPASHEINVSAQSSNKLPMGARLRLANTPAVNALIAQMGPEAQIIATAMQQYGLILADDGSAMYVSGTSASVNTNGSSSTWSDSWNGGGLNDVLSLESLTASDFQVVDLTPVVTGLSSTIGTAGTTVTITGQNFSGAAGNLSVYFGSTASPSVTVVSDTQITAVVPSGSGTVNVTVQSGVNETDLNSSNPNANVTAPVFGYGTSTTSSADSFTYINQTISSSNSTVSFARSSADAGTADRLTVVVKDTTGAGVSELPSSAFQLSLAGGTSAGTFGTVTETGTSDVYTVTFIGSTAGTTSTLTVTVGGVQLSSQPSVQVTPIAVNAANSTASFASTSVLAGGTDVVTIRVKDAAGNAITRLPGSDFVLHLAGGTSTGSFGPVTETATPGTYTAVFTGTTTGTPSTLALTVHLVSLAAQPAVTVNAPPTAPPPPPSTPHRSRPVPLYASASGAGGPGVVTVFSPATNGTILAFQPFSGYAGGIKVAVGDVTGDGYDDLIVMAGPGALNGLVEIYSGKDFSLLSEYFAFPGYAGEFNIAAGDLTGTGTADVIFSTATGGDFVFAYAGASTQMITLFSAFGGFTGGVTIAAGDVQGVGHDQIIVGTASQVGAAGVFNASGQLLQPYDFAPIPMNGVNVATGDLNGSGHDDIIFGARTGSTLVLEYDGVSQGLMGWFFAYPGQSFGVTVATEDPTGGGYADIVTGFTGNVSAIALYSGLSFQLMTVDGQPSGPGGVNVAGSVWI